MGMDAATGQIVAARLTCREVDGGSQVGLVLDQGTGLVAWLTGDGADDRGEVYDAVPERHPTATIVVPPARRRSPATRPGRKGHAGGGPPRRPNATAIFRPLRRTGAWLSKRPPDTIFVLW